MGLVRDRGRGATGFTLGPEQNIFTGADRAAAEAERDAYAVANPLWLTSYNNDTGLNIRLEYTESSNAIAQFQVRNSDGDAWLDNSSATGVQGDPGVDGMDISQFSSIADRDTFFTANPNLLESNLPISVVIDNNVIDMQVWNGASSPASYNPVTDSILWLPASIRAGTSSFELADSQAITSGGDNVLLEERVRNISAAPIAQILGNHQDPNSRSVSNSPVSRKYTPGEGLPPAQSAPSPPAASGSIPFDTSFPVGAENTALFGLEYIPEEDYTGIIEYNLVNTDADRTVYTARQQVTLVAGTNYTQWFRSPASSRAGANVRGRLFKEDRTILSVRPRTDDGSLPYTNSHLRRYEDELVLTESSASASHPVTLRRDMPSEDDAQLIADSSLNGNSALWLTANNQLTNSNRANATIAAQTEGLLDADGNEIPTTATQADNIRMRIGSDVRLFSANEYRVITSPILNSDILAKTDPLQAQIDAISGGMPGMPTSRFDGTFIPFTQSVNIGSENFDTYTGKTALYARSDNARVNFVLPTDSEITAEGVSTNAQVEYAILNQAGTQRFDTGGGSIGPNNTVRIDVEGTNNIRRNTADGTLLNFIEAHQNDLVTLIQSSRGEPWVAVRVTLSSAALLLPTGLFRLQVGTRITANPVLSGLAGFPSGTTPQAGDAYEISTGNPAFGGYGIDTGDVIVALQDAPSLLNNSSNDDWIVIRNATNDIISLAEIHFLNTVQEDQSFEDDRLMSRADVNDVRVFLSTGVLDHAPFVNPSDDTSGNPQASNGALYVGGDEDISSGNEFHLTDFTKVGEQAGSTRFPNAFVYFDIDGAFDVSDLSNVFLVVRDSQGNEVSRHNASTEFRPVILTGSADTYYVFDTIPTASDNFSTITYLSGYTIDVVYRRTLRSFTLSSAVNALGAIADNSIPISKLEPNVQALINANHSLTDAQESALRGLITTGTSTPWTAGDLYAKDNDASPTSEEGHYYNVGQQNGILSNHGASRAVTFVVPSFVSVTGLQRTDDTSQKLSATHIGAITIQDTTVSPPRTFNGQGFTANLPSSSFDINNPVGDVWQVDGTASNLFLSGAESTFKAGFQNLEQEVITAINSHPAQDRPEIETDFFSHLTAEASTTNTEWRDIGQPDNSPILTRQFAALWDENRNTFGTDSYFDDLTGAEILGFNNNNIFYYADGNDPLNTAFPGAQSFILNDNIRVRNQAGQSVISDRYEKIIAFDYALSAPLGTGQNFEMLRIGPSGTTPLIGISEAEGLYLNIGRGDGGQRSRTITENLIGTGGYTEYGFGTVGGQSTSGEAAFLGPNPNVEGTVFPVTVRVKFRLDNNGNDEGTITHNYVITDLNTDQGASNFDIVHNIPGVGNRVFSWSIRYEANYNHAVFGQQNIIFVSDVSPETNAALRDYVSMDYERTVTWTAPSTYARQTINAGSGHDDFGLFDPHQYNTEHVHERNRVILAFRRFELTDVSTDPEMAVLVIVDGEREGDSSSSYLIRLHRPADDFVFDDISFGNNAAAISHIQIYDYDEGHLFGEDTLLRYYNNANQWLGFFRHPTQLINHFSLDADLEFADGEGPVLIDKTTGDRYLLTIDNGVFSPVLQ